MKTDAARRAAPLVTLGALILGFGWLARAVLAGRTEAFDAWWAALIRPAGSAAPVGPAWLHESARDVTALGSYVLLGFVLVVVGGYLLLTSRRATAALLAGSAIGAAILNTALKSAFDRPRPDVPGAVRVFTESFPSAHAMVSAATWLMLAAILARAATDRRLKIYFVAVGVLLTLLIGVSRVYVGVHHATDVLAGWCAGAAWAMLCWAIADRSTRRAPPERTGRPDAR
jgi:undecaprenyl-diphosphatase